MIKKEKILPAAGVFFLRCGDVCIIALISLHNTVVNIALWREVKKKWQSRA